MIRSQNQPKQFRDDFDLGLMEFRIKHQRIRIEHLLRISHFDMIIPSLLKGTKVWCFIQHLFETP